MGYSQSVTNRQKLKAVIRDTQVLDVWVEEYEGTVSLFKVWALSCAAVFQEVYRVLQLWRAHRQPDLPAPVQG